MYGDDSHCQSTRHRTCEMDDSLRITEVQQEKDGIRMDIPRRNSVFIIYQWLRDHCRCPYCWNETTHQRKLNILDFPPDVTPLDCRLSDGILTVTWVGGHESKYKLDWLVEMVTTSNYNEGVQKIPWLRVPKVARVDSDSYMNTTAGLKVVLTSLLQYGIAFVTGVDATIEATERIITRMAPVQKTFFGEMWTVYDKADDTKHKDTAYSKCRLEAHTDNTYWSDAAGLQVFHCLKPAVTGGETLVVDGFRVSQEMKYEHPESYERLTKTPFAAMYVDDEQYHTHVDPIIKLHPVTKELLQFRFNLYDRTILRNLNRNEVEEYYHDLRVIAAKIADKNGENYLSLGPGEVAFIDNWRVMHGRSEYTGERKMVGGYVGYTDWQSKARVLRLIN